MDELSFRCPAYLAQRFWLYAQQQGETPGTLLRQFMMEQINSVDAAFVFDQKSITGLDQWSVAQGLPEKRDSATQFPD